MQAEEDENLVRLEIFELTVGVFDLNPTELVAVPQKRMHDCLDVAHAAARDQVLHLGNRRRGGTKFGTPMHERQAARLPSQLQRPIQRRVATTEDDEPLTGEVGCILHFVMYVAPLEGLGTLHGKPSWLKRTQTARDDHGARMEARIERSAQQERPIPQALEFDNLLAEVKLCVERLDLLEQPIDQLLRADDGQRGNVVDRLFGIQLATLPAGMLERIHDVRMDAQEPELEDLKQAARSRADNDGVCLNRALDWRGCRRLAQSRSPHRPRPYGRGTLYERSGLFGKYKLPQRRAL